MEAGILPISRSLRQTVLDRVVMDVFHVLDQVALVPNLVLPEAPLPYCLLTLPPPRWRDAFSIGLRTRAGKGTLDQPPARREVSVSFRQCPDTVQMVGQEDKGIDLEGMTRHYVPERLPQTGDVFRVAQEPSSAVGDDGKEVGPTFRACTSVFHLLNLVTSGALVQGHPGQGVG